MWEIHSRITTNICVPKAHICYQKPAEGSTFLALLALAATGCIHLLRGFTDDESGQGLKSLQSFKKDGSYAQGHLMGKGILRHVFSSTQELPFLTQWCCENSTTWSYPPYLLPQALAHLPNVPALQRPLQARLIVEVAPWHRVLVKRRL